MKKILAFITAVMLLLTCLPAASFADSTPTVRWLNVKQEIAGQMEALAKLYTEKTGVNVIVETAVSGTYYTTLNARLDTRNAPSVFSLENQNVLVEFQDYCLDLTDTVLNSWVPNESMCRKLDGRVYAIAIAMEGFGIITNKSIMEKYFTSPNKKTEYSSLDEMFTFDALKAVVEDMSTMKEELGIEGVFGTTTLQAGQDWRYATHAMSLPLFWEFGGNDNIDMNAPIPEFSFAYADGYKNLLDLYLNNSVTEPALVGTKTVDDSMAEFALGKCAMIQNGDWAWGTIEGTDGCVVTADDVCFLPLTIGADGESDMGLVGGGSTYIAVNSQLSAADQKATLDFLEWLFSSDEGKNYVTNELGFVCPLTTFSDITYSNPLQNSEKDIAAMGKESYCWACNLIPDDVWKNEFASSLLMYAQGQKDWADVVKDAIDIWAVEREITNAAR